MTRITASKLYNYLQCPHLIWREVYGPQEEKRTEVNPFIQMLWDKGVQHEEKVIKEIGKFIDISRGSFKERFAGTITAMEDNAPLIYQGVLYSGNLFGIPDLLKRMPDGSYIPIDIKSGSGLENKNGKEKLKKHYAVQLCLYAELLQQLGFQNDRQGRVLDIHNNEIEYRLDEPIDNGNGMTCWEFYQKIKGQTQSLLNDQTRNKPAMSGVCKLCPWYDSCKKWCQENQDLTMIFYLGRSKRDAINEELQIEKVNVFSQLDTEEVMRKKKENKNFLKSIGEKTLNKLVARAKILSDIKKPVVYGKVDFPQASCELFFDIEDDPTQEFVYLHGIYERRGNKERFISFVADGETAAAEATAWKNFWDYIKTLPQDDFAIYYYSPHEKNTYRRMQKQYPEIISAEDVDNFFSDPRVIDLYQIVLKYTDWPLSSYSLKELAMYLGFKWRDSTPSGALSIEWYNKYLETKDEKILNRILLYNEDDCKATMVLKDAIYKLSKEYNKHADR